MNALREVSKEVGYRAVVALGQPVWTRPKRNSLHLDVPLFKERTTSCTQAEGRLVATLVLAISFLCGANKEDRNVMVWYWCALETLQSAREMIPTFTTTQN